VAHFEVRIEPFERERERQAMENEMRVPTPVTDDQSGDLWGAVSNLNKFSPGEAGSGVVGANCNAMTTFEDGSRVLR
jgi:hypothetical protein